MDAKRESEGGFSESLTVVPVVLPWIDWVWVLVLAALFGSAALGVTHWHWSWLPAVGLLDLLRRWLRGRPARTQRVEVRDGALWVDGVKRTERARLGSGVYHPGPDGEGGRIKLFNRQGRQVFEAHAEQEQAQQILRALKVDVLHRPARWNVAAPLLQTTATRMAGLAAGLGLAIMINWTAGVGAAVSVGVVACLALVLALFPARLTVGGDGVLWQWLFWKRFWSLAGIEDCAVADSNTVTLRLRSGASVNLATNLGKVSHRDEIHQRIREALAARDQGEHADAASLVGRAERDGPAWVKALRAVRTGESDYRNARVPPEALWRVVEDVRAEPSARLGAAAVLRQGLDETGRTRIRELGEASASPRVRVGLARVADASDEEAYEAAAQAEAEAEDLVAARRQRPQHPAP